MVHTIQTPVLRLAGNPTSAARMTSVWLVIGCVFWEISWEIKFLVLYILFYCNLKKKATYLCILKSACPLPFYHTGISFMCYECFLPETEQYCKRFWATVHNLNSKKHLHICHFSFICSELVVFVASSSDQMNRGLLF